MRGDITKLPKWAQNEINRLERNIEVYHAKLSAGPEDSDTFADPYSAAPRPLGRETTVEFRLGEERQNYVRATIQHDSHGTTWLYVHGGEKMLVQPRSSNVIEIKMEKFS